MATRLVTVDGKRLVAVACISSNIWHLSNGRDPSSLCGMRERAFGVGPKSPTVCGRCVYAYRQQKGN